MGNYKKVKKVQFFEDELKYNLQNKVNTFIARKEVENIGFGAYCLPDGTVCYTAFVVYLDWAYHPDH